jgi:ABC-2 family transporter protein
MVWLSWRQHRVELLTVLGLGLGLAALMTVVSIEAQSSFGAVRQSCAGAPGPQCVTESINFGSQFTTVFEAFQGLLLALPGLAGIFIGAPLLAREFEQGTARLVWTQGITRRRWFAMKLGVILVVAVAVASLLGAVGSLMTGTPGGIFDSRWSSFDVQGLVLVAYVIFGIALGAAAGAITRRTVPAMAVTLVAFIAIRIAVYNWVRPNLLPPLSWDTSKLALNSGDSWNLGQRAVDLSGHPVSDQYYQQLLANAGVLPGSFADYMRAHGVVVLQLYQPESRFWLFQGMEGALFVVLAAALIGLTIWAIRRA